MLRTALSIAAAVLMAIGLQDCAGTPAPAESAATEVVDVLTVIDGDTIRVRYKGESQRVRLIGLDAPELGRDGAPDECWALEATEILEHFLSARIVELRIDPTQGDTDRYGSLLRHVFVDQQSAAIVLIEAGAAREYTYARPYDGQETHRQAEAVARDASHGLWGGC